MQVIRIITDLRVNDLDAAKEFYTRYLGLSSEEFNLGWVARYTSPRNGERIQILTRDAAAPVDPVVSVQTPTSRRPTKRLRNSGTRSCTR